MRRGKPVVIADPRSAAERARARGCGRRRAYTDRAGLRPSPRRQRLAPRADPDCARAAAAAVRRRRAVRQRGGLRRGRRAPRERPAGRATRRSRRVSAARVPSRPARAAAVDGVEWVFDVAHNPAAAANLRARRSRGCRGRRARSPCSLPCATRIVAGVVAPFVPLGRSVGSWRRASPIAARRRR